MIEMSGQWWLEVISQPYVQLCFSQPCAQRVWSVSPGWNKLASICQSEWVEAANILFLYRNCQVRKHLLEATDAALGLCQLSALGFDEIRCCNISKTQKLMHPVDLLTIQCGIVFLVDFSMIFYHISSCPLMASFTSTSFQRLEGPSYFWLVD